jgi:hypothetical protein
MRDSSREHKKRLSSFLSTDFFYSFAYFEPFPTITNLISLISLITSGAAFLV